MWKSIIIGAHELEGMLYPYLIQGMLYSVYCANHNTRNNHINKNCFKTEEWSDKKAKDVQYCLYKEANLATYTYTSMDCTY